MPNPSTGPGQPRHQVTTVIYEGLCTFEFGIAVEVFGLPRPEFGFPWYDFNVASAEGRRVRAVGGVTVEADAALEALDAADTIIIPGWRGNTEIPPKPLLDAVCRAHERGARLLSLCSGVFVLAAAGLLNGRRATTHWRHIPDLQRLYPEIMIEPDVLYVDEGGVISAAGSTAGLDACMYIVKRDHGSRPANLVARRLVMPPHPCRSVPDERWHRSWTGPARSSMNRSTSQRSPTAPP
jgi:AraC family transcriptional regulator, transcriptional activator FtrA